jgi:hypothetical protein
VLVHAATVSVGGFAVQLAKAAKVIVIGTRSAPNAKYVPLRFGRCPKIGPEPKRARQSCEPTISGFGCCP